MEADELVLSDVHVGKDHTIGSFPSGNRTDKNDIPSDGRRQYPVAVSRFLFQVPEQENIYLEDGPESTIKDEKKAEFETTEDEDGDLVLARRPAAVVYDEAITIEHTLETTLADVGLQVWQGCLLLCDYIVQHQQMFEDCVAIELGGGVGLASVVLARVARSVFCTDVGNAILDKCQKNAELNRHLFKHGNSHLHVIRVRELDWTKGIIHQKDGKEDNCLYTWNDDDLRLLEEVQVIIAADVIYDNNLTDAFFTTLHSLMSVKPTKTLYVSLERRLNFTMDSLDVSCPAYDYFGCSLKELEGKEGVKYTVEKLDTDFTQCFHYDRTKYLELWRISASFPS